MEIAEKTTYKAENIASGIKAFINDYPDYKDGKYKISQKTFRRYLDEYGKFIEMNFMEGKDHNGRWFEYYEETLSEQPEPVEDPF